MGTSRRLLVAVLVTVLVSGAGIAIMGARVSSVDPVAARAAPVNAAWGVRPGLRGLRILHAWDRRRSQAWAAGDPAELARLYLPGSRTGRRDVTMLRQWRSRGVSVADLQVQLLAARVGSVGERRIVLVVTDRVVGGRVVGRGWGADLPRDRATTRVIQLRRILGGWRVDEVREVRAMRGQARALRRIARTPSSRNW